jgi:hypothetical protein
VLKMGHADAGHWRARGHLAGGEEWGARRRQARTIQADRGRRSTVSRHRAALAANRTTPESQTAKRAIPDRHDAGRTMPVEAAVRSQRDRSARRSSRRANPWPPPGC